MDQQNNNAGNNMGGQEQNSSSNNPTPMQTSSTPKNRTLMGVLAYLGILVLIPLLMDKKDPVVKFHVKQGLVLFIIEVAITIIGTVTWQLWALLNIIQLATLVLSIIGIVNVVQEKEKELPLIGGLAKNFTF